jgi:heme A synthase
MPFVTFVIFQIHRVFGEMILPLLIVAAALYLTFTYKSDGPRSPIARIFPMLVDLQVGLGILLWVLKLITIPGGMALYLGFPFILHPILGLIAAGIAHTPTGIRNPLRSLGRWAPLASLAVLLLLVVGNAILARRV